MSIKLPDKWKKILSKIASKDKLLIFLLAGVLLIIINIPVKSSTAKAKNSDTTVKERRLTVHIIYQHWKRNFRRHLPNAKV